MQDANHLICSRITRILRMQDVVSGLEVTRITRIQVSRYANPQVVHLGEHELWHTELDGNHDVMTRIKEDHHDHVPDLGPKDQIEGSDLQIQGLNLQIQGLDLQIEGPNLRI